MYPFSAAGLADGEGEDVIGLVNAAGGCEFLDGLANDELSDDRWRIEGRGTLTVTGRLAVDKATAGGRALDLSLIHI